MIGFNIADVTAISLGSVEISSIYAGNSVIWEDTPDYEKKYLTTIAKGSGNIGFDIPADVSTSDLISISYSTDNGSTWTTTNNVDSQAVTITVPVNNGDKVLWKGVGITMTNSQSHFTSTVNFDVEGNIMSLLNGDNFYQSTFDTSFSDQFYYLFNNTDVVDASNLILPATTLATSCYAYMFEGCTKLTAAPTLPATTLTEYCYYQMFRNCTSLTTAPELPATTLAQQCYDSMFNGCTNLNYIKMMATDISAYDCLYNWVYDVAATGTFVKDASATIPTGDSGIPTGWTVENYNKYEHQYFTTVAKGSGNIGFKIPTNIPTTVLTSISYSTDDGTTWTTTNNVDSQEVTVTVPVNNGDKVLWKGVGTTMCYDYNYARFTSSTFFSYDVEGNIMSLLNGDNFYHSSFASGSTYNFHNLFNNGKVVDASNLILPATTLANYCYSSMFFACTKLTTAPELPATTLASHCYDNMFGNCTSLTTAPELPATTLASYCYYGMLQNCTSLTTAPELPATTLIYYCYYGMFMGCTNLNYIKMLATDISTSNCLTNWVSGVSATGTFVKDASATIPTGTSGIPSGWTVQNIGDYEQQYFTTVARESGNIVFNIPSNVTTTYVTSISYSTDNGSTWTTTNNVNSQDVTVTVPVNNGDKVLWKGVANAMRDGLYGYTKFTTTIDYDVEGNIMSLLNGDNFYHSSFASGYTSNLYKLFENNNIIDASNLVIPATTLKDYCYEDMFKGCTKLTAAPALPATTLVEGCYKSMFYGCSHLNYIKMLATNISANSCLFQWVYAVQAGGTFVKNASMTTLPTGASGIPSGWTVQDAA